jgi:SAM-dependent methyltransferase
MATYDRFAKLWHSVTGSEGGAFKKHVLNDRIIGKIDAIEGRSILEMGAGNGYFIRLMLRRFPGQTPERVVVTDCAETLLELARRHFRVAGAEYEKLDVRGPFPFSDGSFDLALATMVFNELSDAGLTRALVECRRVLREDGSMIATVVHPTFVQSLSSRGQLRNGRGGVMTMPGAKGLRLPVFPRSAERYESLLSRSGFASEREDIHATDRVLAEKPGLRQAGNVPIAQMFTCRGLRRGQTPD